MGNHAQRNGERNRFPALNPDTSLETVSGCPEQTVVRRGSSVFCASKHTEAETQANATGLPSFNIASLPSSSLTPTYVHYTPPSLSPRRLALLLNANRYEKPLERNERVCEGHPDTSARPNGKSGINRFGQQTVLPAYFYPVLTMKTPAGVAGV